MNRIFRFEMAVRTGLMVTLALAVVFAAGCPKKQQGESSQTPPSSASSDKKPPKQDTKIQPPAEVNQNALASPAQVVMDNKTAAVANAPAKKVTPPATDDRKKTEPPVAAEQPQEPNLSEPAELKPFDALKTSEEKVDFISDFADAHPELIPALVYKALDDNDLDVRTAAMEALSASDVNDPNVTYVAAKALKDTEPDIRKSAIQACENLTDPAVGKVFLDALVDESEDVRTAALQAADQKEPAVRLSVLNAGITSKYEDVKESAVSSLIDVSTPAAMDILITGLKDTNPDFRDTVKSAIDFLVSQEFDTYAQAQKWWDANRTKFNDDLSEKD
jgi:HEAT repeat protein